MGFDLAAIAWYAVICGSLSALAPSLGGRAIRIAIGGLVGIVAATLLPVARGLAGL